VSIFVGNLPFRAEREDVLELFSPYGEVTNCSLPLERDTGRKRGFAFVEMADEVTESSAIESLQGSEMMGRPLRINKAEPRTNSPRRNNYNSRGSNNSGGYASNNSGGYGSNNSGGYGSNNNGGYASNNNGGYASNNNGGYASNNSGGYASNNSGGYASNNEQSSNFDSRSSGSKGWEDRSFGNNTENSEFESSRSRRKRSGSSSSEQE